MQLSRPHLQSASKGVAPVSTARTPLTRLSQAVGSHGPCHQAASVYGKCVATNYQQVEKDSCLMEFVSFKQCVQRTIVFGLKFDAYKPSHPLRSSLSHTNRLLVLYPWALLSIPASLPFPFPLHTTYG
ncbi:hypothetical protein PGTUg99_018478 [Puccinia graminis f. sp. tritici]|uniref:Uncharacterized protein n=1 Tax=Puccinia graminis f. sp. tritici TaxID=56615 RepID=A0A5B0RTS6_PUCGR|nr:hypothetical protein PGTUg99_018478 [Puccinia graminis f. sp. tritici]